MKLGLNLSFAVKRWPEPEHLASIIRSDFDIKWIQFTWDLIDPWWPPEMRDKLAKAFSRAFGSEGLVIAGTFGGVASYTYNHLLAPSEEQREVAKIFFKRAIDMTSEMGVEEIGTPLGGMSDRDSNDEKRKEEIYSWTIESVHELCRHAKLRGLKRIVIEPTPLATEIPYNVSGTVKLIEELRGRTDVPVGILLDWGHVLYEPLMKNEAKMELWLEKCKDYIQCFHLQQTDGQLDRHWSFTRAGIVDPEYVENVSEKYKVRDLIQYLEILYPFEVTDAFVRDDMRKTVDIVRRSPAKEL
jgi:sugar phosphate isomerase/epimerase